MAEVKILSPSKAMTIRLRQSQLRNRLSDREYEVATLLADGNEVKAIAKELGIQPTTAASYTEKARNKLGAKNNLQLIAILRETFGLGSRDLAACTVAEESPRLEI